MSTWMTRFFDLNEKLRLFKTGSIYECNFGLTPLNDAWQLDIKLELSNHILLNKDIPKLKERFLFLKKKMKLVEKEITKFILNEEPSSGDNLP